MGPMRAAVILTLAWAALPAGLVHPGMAETTLLPVQPTAPADGLAVAADGDPPDVKLDWSVPAEPAPVRFFVEVVAIDQAGPREVFAGYVDHPPVTVVLADGSSHYAWRVYSVGRDIPAYALSTWERFSLQAK